MTVPATYAKRFALGVATLAAEATNPNASGGTAASAGSLWTRATPTGGAQLFQNVDGGATTWSIDNLVNLTIYNVKTYGATGDGITDDMVAINAAVTAAIAGGGGGIYFPPGTYRVTKPAANFGSIFLNNIKDLTFFGDGFASTISMIGSAAFGDWYMFRTVNGTSRIKWYNLGFASNITNKDPAEQNHFLNLSGSASFGAGGTSHCDVINCYFGGIWGAGVRNLGESTHEVTDIKVLYNDFNMTAARSAVEAQRFSNAISVCYNFITGPAGQQIDFEPTSGDGPVNWCIVGNQIDASSSTAGAAVTLSGSGNLSANNNRRLVFAFNSVTHGGSIGGVKGLFNCDVIGNICTIDSTDVSSGLAPFDQGQLTQNCSYVGNVGINQVTTNNRSGFRIAGSASLSAPARRCLIAENVITVMGTNCQSVTCPDLSESTFIGNIIQADVSLASGASGIAVVATSESVDHVSCVGNMLIAVNQSMAMAFNLSCSGFDYHNYAVQHNYSRNSVNIVTSSRNVSELYSDWHLICGNNGVACTGVPLNVVSNGTSAEGSAGPGAQIAVSQGASGPEAVVVAPVGSLATSTIGGDAKTIFYKESGSGVSGGNTGWIGQGPSEIIFGTQDAGTATAARFLAPSQGLATIATVAVEIALPVGGTLRNMRVQCVAGTGGANATYTIFKNGVATAVTTTLLNIATAGTGTGTNVVAAGDLISVRCTKSVGPVAGQTFVLVTFELTA